MLDFLKRLKEASAQADAKAAARRQERLAAGLQETAGTGTPEAEIAFEIIPPNNVPEVFDYEDLPKVLQAMESAALDGLPTGASRLGGLPDLPSSIVWPEFEGKCLPFIAQINLSDIPDTRMNALPSRGWLCVFGVFDDARDSVTLINFDGDPSQLIRAERPQVERMWSDWCGTQFYSTVPLSVAEADIHSAWDDLGGWLFGQMCDVFGTPGEEADHAMKDGDDWINLFAITSAGNMEWSDSGHLYLLIRRCDLASQDFSKVLGVIKSS